MSLDLKLPLVVTAGEPAGIGWEITAKAWKMGSKVSHPFYFLFDFNLLTKLTKEIGLNIPLKKIQSPEEATRIFPNALPVLDTPFSGIVTNGKPTEITALDVIHSVKLATIHTQTNLAAGIITNPIQKSILYKSGFEYPGHTEFLGSLVKDSLPWMMLVCKELKVVPISVHIDLLNAILKLNKVEIIEKTCLTFEVLASDFKISSPHVAIAGLNPHAGEDGKIGNQEETIITPAIKSLVDRGLNVSGPYAPDTLFSNHMRKKYDAAVCMYHDQALIPIKTLDFSGTVNITLGLPFVRTSPDHGTALDIAGLGVANEASMLSAINLAAQISKNRLINKHKE